LTDRPSDRLTRALGEAAAANRLSLVPFVTAGFPTPDTTLDLLRALDDAGADAIEVGIPFSDPIADGPTIQRTSQISLDHGMTVRRVLDLVAAFRSTSGTPVVLMTYVNPILRYGVDEFSRDAVRSGAEAILGTDLPPDESPDVWSAVRAAGLATIQLIAPTTSLSRIPAIASAASGFVYCVSRTGVTGRGASFATNLDTQVGRVRDACELPVLVGFGVRRPEDVENVKGFADGVVVGTAVLECVLTATTTEVGIADASALLRSLAGSLDKGQAA